jgi:cytoskeletal protein CcmA (bactofilin family)
MWKPISQTAPSTNTNPNPSPKPVTTSEPEKAPVSTSSSIFVEPTPTRNVALGAQEQASIGKSLIIKGEVTGSESLYVDGRVEGSINLPGHRVTIGRNGHVTANVTARELVVLGKMKGNVTASDRVDIRNEGSLTGDVACQRISIEDGAYFKGGIDIHKANAKESPGMGQTKLESTAAETPRVISATA